MRPLILISPDERPSSDGRPYYFLKRSYGLAVLAAGGAPVMAADPGCFAEYASLFAGLVLTDGTLYISPGRYSGAVDKSTGHTPFDLPVSAARDSRELCLCRAFLDAGKPVLGIGRGMNVINVALGGTLKARVKGSGKPSAYPQGLSKISSLEGSALRSLKGESFEALCCSLQGPDRLGEGLAAAAVDEDGMVAAFGHESLPVMGLLWHPEPLEDDLRLYNENKDKDSPFEPSEEEKKAMRARAVTKEPDPALPGDREALPKEADPLLKRFVSLCEGGERLGK